MSYSHWAQKYRVPAGFFVALLFLTLCRPTWELLCWGSLISILGIAVRVWAAGHLEKARRLVTDGPYRYTRNPLYLGSFLLLLGFIVAGGSWVAAAAALLFFAAVYIPTMRREAVELRAGFHEAYDRYAAQVPLFFPRWTPFQPSGGPFRLRQVLHNREYNSALGCAVGLLLIYLKLQWFS